MIDRKYFRIIEEELKNKKITALIGSRQVGKTTILKYIYEKVKKESIFLSFDDISILNLFDNDINLFIEQYIKPYKIIFIDEIQYSKKGGKYLKLIFDKYEKKIFISGSSSPEISINLLQYLVGRVNIIEVYPLTFKEYLNFVSKEKIILLDKMRTQTQLKQLKTEFENYLRFGGYPDVILENNFEKKEKIIKNLINTYLFKEIKEILNFKNLFEYEVLLKRLALTDGQIINKSSISAELNINRVKISNMIEILEKTFILKRLTPYYSNKIKELIKSPKIYFQDLGFKNSLINNFNTLDLKQDKGQIYENFILNTIIREEITNINFWNLKNEYELDFVYERNNRLIGFEVKSFLKNNNITKSIKKFIDLNDNVEKVYVLNENIDDVREYNGVEIVFTNYINIFPIIKELSKYKY
jgi:hypothetical protein